jgi:citrate lyase subunit beta/citryl-CoA lyase
LRRSVLIFPGDKPALFADAAGSEADVIVFDWEDDVYNSRKDKAREITKVALGNHNWTGHEIAIRVNNPDTPYFVDDIEAAVALPVDGIRLTKMRHVADVVAAIDVIERAERAVRPSSLSPIDVWVSIETAQALVGVNEIASCHPRLTAISLGGGDFGVDLRVKQVQIGQRRSFGPVRFEYLYAQGRIVAAARANNLDPIETGYMSADDDEGSTRVAAFAAQMGFAGSIALTPRQAAVMNAAFSPSREEISWAREVIRQSDLAAETQESPAIVIGGELLHKPHVLNAHQMIDLDDAAQARRQLVSRS